MFAPVRGKSKLRGSMPLSVIVVTVVAGALAAPALGVVDRGGGQSAVAAPFVINMPVGPATLDPATACGFSDLTIVNHVYSRLTRYGSKPGPNGTTQIDASKIIPDLARSWTITNAGKRYTFKLRPGNTFASGRPVNSAAVKYSFERTATMNTCGASIMGDGYVPPATPMIRSIETPNPTTVVINLNFRNPNALQDWAQAAASIVDPSVVEANGGVQPSKLNPYMAGHVAGAGPYVLQSWAPNERAVLVANRRYWRQPKARNVVFNFISSDPTLLLQARSGAADVTLALSGQSVHSLRDNKDVRIIANDATVTHQIGLVNTHPPLNNVRVRQALTLAVPYSPILNKVMFGYGKLYYGALPPAFPTFNAKLEQPVKLDLAKAKSLIAASGIQTPVRLTMVIQSGNAVQQQIATVVQGVWKGLGINLEVFPLSAADYASAVLARRYDMYIRLSGPGIIDAGYYLSYDMQCGIFNNYAAICIPQADKLLKQMRLTEDPAKRRVLLDKILVLWRANWPKIQVVAVKDTAVLNKRVKTYFYSHEIDISDWSK